MMRGTRKKKSGYRLTGSVLSIAAVLLIASGCDVENVPGNAPPTVREVSLASGPQNGETYGVNETIRVDVIFDQPVMVTGTPRLALGVGTVSRAVDMADAWDRGIAFIYVVQAGDLDSDGISIAADALTLNGGTIRDDGGNAAVLGLGKHTIINAAGHKVDGDPPTVRTMWLPYGPHKGDTYGEGEVIGIDVVFSERIVVTGTPRLALTIGSVTRLVDMAFVFGTTDGIRFNYVVQADDRDGDGISVGSNALTLNGGTIRDADETAVALDLGEHAITNDGRHKVDGSIKR